MKFIKNKKIERTKEIKERTGVSIKAVRTAFVIGTLFLIVAGPIAFFKVNKMRADLEVQQREILKAVEDSQAGSSSETVKSTELSKRFLEQFIKAYVSIPKEHENFDKRIQTLQDTYYSFEQNEGVYKGIERKLLSSQFYDFENVEGREVAKYKVSYELIRPVTKEKEVKKKEGDKEIIKKEPYIDYEKSTKEVLLNIPFKEYEDGTFKVTNNPYFSKERALTKEKMIEPNQLKKSDYKALSNQEDKEVKEFVADFLEKYTEAEEKDMQYMMKEPEVLGDGYKIKNIQAESYSKGKQIISFLTYDLTDEKTDVSHKEEMTLLMSKRDGKFIVDKMVHFLGGI